MNKLISVILLFFVSVASNAQVRYPLKMANIFGDNMVIQQNRKVPVWGVSTPGERVAVEFAGTTTVTQAGNDGKWMLRLPVMKAGGPFEMKVSAGGTAITFHNVMTGEVWIASGQSNMQFTLSNTTNDQAVLQQADNPYIRMFTVQQETGMAPLSDVVPSAWRVCNPATAGYFSAVGYYFAKSIFEARYVPVGIVNSSWGGSAAEAWTSAETLTNLADFKDKMLTLDMDTARWNARVVRSKQLEQERAILAKTAQEGTRQGVHLPAYNDAAWKQTEYPLNMEKLSMPGHWGFVWFRKEVELPVAAANTPLTMTLPIYSDEHNIYFNGTPIAHVEKNSSVKYTIPAALVQAGRNSIAIRMRTYFGTGRLGDASVPTPLIEPANKQWQVSIGGKWKHHAGIEPKLAYWQDYFNTPTVIYNAMIAPLMPFAIRGVIWYQGESNVGKANQYYTLFPALIDDWRRHWEQDNFPFLFVQLASIKKQGSTDMKWALLREAQDRTLRISNTGMATAVDLGLKDDIHPKNKKDVGARLSLVARKLVYGENIVSSGPVYESATINGSTMRIRFSSTGSGLIARDSGSLKGFLIAGEDKIFYPAVAAIEGQEVVVRSAKVASPMAVRYSFESWPDGNLYNREGLPAPPFRTDNWNVLP